MVKTEGVLRPLRFDARALESLIIYNSVMTRTPGLSGLIKNTQRCNSDMYVINDYVSEQ